MSARASLNPPKPLTCLMMPPPPTPSHTSQASGPPPADNDNYNKREYVVRVLVKVVDNFHVADAVNVMQVRRGGTTA